jgi:hypothetical protein
MLEGIQGVLVRLPAEFMGGQMIAFAMGSGGGAMRVGRQVVELGDSIMRFVARFVLPTG